MVKFPGHTTIIAKDQPEYEPMPAHVDITGTVTCCWELSWRERVKILLNGKVWHQILTFGSALQPQRLDADRPVLGMHYGFEKN